MRQALLSSLLSTDRVPLRERQITTPITHTSYSAYTTQFLAVVASIPTRLVIYRPRYIFPDNHALAVIAAKARCVKLSPWRKCTLPLPTATDARVEDFEHRAWRFVIMRTAVLSTFTVHV